MRGAFRPAAADQFGYKKPAWQSGPGFPTTARATCRRLPGRFERPRPYIIVSEGEAYAVGGTSAAAPSLAGMIALLNQYLVQNEIQTNPAWATSTPNCTPWRRGHLRVFTT